VKRSPYLSSDNFGSFNFPDFDEFGGKIDWLRSLLQISSPSTDLLSPAHTNSTYFTTLHNTSLATRPYLELPLTPDLTHSLHATPYSPFLTLGWHLVHISSINYSSSHGHSTLYLLIDTRVLSVPFTPEWAHEPHRPLTRYSVLMHFLQNLDTQY
jgi:hypothetical protein